MSKIRVVHHSKNIGYSGTDKTAQIFCEYLSLFSDKYEPFLVYRDDGDHSMLPAMQEVLGKENVRQYHWKPGKKGRRPPYLPEEDDFYDVVNEINPGIVHIHRAGREEWPGMRWLAPKAKWVETNIFGEADKSGQIDKHIYISNFIRDVAIKKGNKDGPVLYNPIHWWHGDLYSGENLEFYFQIKSVLKAKFLYKYGLPYNSILLGRVGRPDNFDPISLKAFKRISDNNPNVFYFVVNPCQGWHDTVKEYDIKNVIFLPAIIDRFELQDFYLSLDIYAHARSDGECCPCNIQEAMIHGNPTVSHYSPMYNGQAEIIGDTGFVVPRDDDAAYAQVLEGLINDISLRNQFARKALDRAATLFNYETIGAQLEGIYDGVLNG